MNIFRRIWDLIVTAWNILCGTGLEADFQTRRFINTCLIILTINTALFVVGFALNWNSAVILSAFVSSIFVLVCWKAADIAVKIISSLSGITIVKSATDELKKLLAPLITVSLFLAFIAAIVAIRGLGYYNYSDLLIWTTVILFTAIFAVYINAKVKIAGWVMIGFLYYLLIGNYLWPIQVQGTLDWMERTTVKRAVVAGDATKDHELVVISNNTPLYNFSFGKFKKEKVTTQTGVVAKVIGRKDDPTSKEPMYEVILPVAENLYVGGEILYVPARLTKLAQKPAEMAVPVATPAIYNVPGKTLAITLQPNEVYMVDEMKEGQSWKYLSFNGAFSHRIDKGDDKACWKVVDNNLPWSAGWNGKLQVKAGNTPVQLTVNIL